MNPKLMRSLCNKGINCSQEGIAFLESKKCKLSPTVKQDIRTIAMNSKVFFIETLAQIDAQDPMGVANNLGMALRNLQLLQKSFENTDIELRPVSEVFPNVIELLTTTIEGDNGNQDIDAKIKSVIIPIPNPQSVVELIKNLIRSENINEHSQEE